MAVDEGLEKFTKLFERVCQEMPNFHPHPDKTLCLHCAQVIARIEWGWGIEEVEGVANEFDFA